MAKITLFNTNTTEGKEITFTRFNMDVSSNGSGCIDFFIPYSEETQKYFNDWIMETIQAEDFRGVVASEKFILIQEIDEQYNDTLLCKCYPILINRLDETLKMRVVFQYYVMPARKNDDEIHYSIRPEQFNRNTEEPKNNNFSKMLNNLIDNLETL
jgi:hypothetical protein